MALVIPRVIEPQALARKGWSVSGVVPREAFQRVPLASAAAEVSVRMWMDEAGALLASGRLSASIAGRCERCLEALDILVDASFRWSMVSPGSATLDAPEWDVIELVGATVDLFELLEDELLLCTPPYPKHVGPCGAEVLAKPPAADPVPVQRPSPFAVLGRLKGSGTVESPGPAASEPTDDPP